MICRRFLTVKRVSEVLAIPSIAGWTLWLGCIDGRHCARSWQAVMHVQGGRGQERDAEQQQAKLIEDMAFLWRVCERRTLDLLYLGAPRALSRS